MAISPDLKPRVSMTTDYDVPTMSTTPTESRNVRIENGSGNSIAYTLGVLALLAVGYLAYAYYGQSGVVPTPTNQSTTTVAPTLAPPPVPAVTAPATAPAAQVPAVAAPATDAPAVKTTP